MKSEKTTRVNNAYIKLKTEIIENRMSPANPMLEQEVAEYLGMSRTPVREALLKLEAEGLVEVVPRRGVKILPVSKEDMAEIYEIFLSLEPVAASNVAKREDLKKEDFKALEEAISTMEQALKNDDLESWAKADLDFHEKLLDLNGNKRLKNILDMLRNQTHRVRLLTRHLRSKPKLSVSEHREVLDYIYKKEDKKAYDAIKKHRQRSVKEIMEILEKLQVQNI